jgi:phosphoglycerate kinase
MITYIDEAEIKDTSVLLRVDFNVSLHPDHTIGDDARIRQSLPTITYLRERRNKIRILTHLGRPAGHDSQFSLQPVAEKLQSLLPGYTVTLIRDYYPETTLLPEQTDTEIFLFENIRFYPEEQENNPDFAKKLASYGSVFVNDAFAVSHRADASVVGLTHLLPSYGGLLLKKEITMLSQMIRTPKKPFVAILGGSKISTKLKLITKLTTLADTLLIGGGLAHNMLKAQGFEIGKSIVEEDLLADAKALFTHGTHTQTNIILPEDAVIQAADGTIRVAPIHAITPTDTIYDIGPDTQALFGHYIDRAHTIVWNGPVGYFEKSEYRRGTDFLYYAIARNADALSIVGGGETIAALSDKEHLERITHISTGGGAMLEYIENGTLPGIEALDK